MDRPEIFGERLQRGRQAFIGRHSVGQDSIAAAGRHDHTLQHRDFRVGIDEGYVGMPVVRTATTVRGVEFQNRGAAGARRRRRMGNNITEARREAFLPGIIELGLIAEKDDFVFGERRLDCRERGIRQVSGKVESIDLGADPTGKRANIEVGNLRLRASQSRHASPRNRYAKGKISNAAIGGQCCCLIGVYRVRYFNKGPGDG